MYESIFRATTTAAQLLRDFQMKRISHAYLIVGEHGSGKATLARAFAHLLLCENPQGCTPCGVCQSCVYMNSFQTHPGLTILKKDSKKATIGVQEVREAVAGIYESPYFGARKVYIVTDAELLTVQAQNALLKILEEPPEYAVFLLLSAKRQAMLPTVISRCRTLAMSPYTSEALFHIAQEQVPLLNTQEISKIVRRSCGLPGKLASLLNTETYQRQIEQLSFCISALLEGNIEQLLLIADGQPSRENAMELTEELGSFMRDAMVYHITRDNTLLVNEDLLPMLQKLTSNASLKQIADYLEQIHLSKKMLMSNASYTLCIKTLLLKWQ